MRNRRELWTRAASSALASVRPNLRADLSEPEEAADVLDASIRAVGYAVVAAFVERFPDASHASTTARDGGNGGNGVEGAEPAEPPDCHTPHALLWLDLETTGLDPETCHIVEVAYELTTFHAPYLPLPGMKGTVYEDVDSCFTSEAPSKDEVLVRGPGRDALLDPSDRRCDAYVRDMHARSGLIEDLRLRYGETLSLEVLERRLLALSEGWPTERDRKVRLAGSSVHFDLAFLRRHMPEFAKRLSHRTFDVSVVSSFLRSVGMPSGPRGDEAHRARADLDYSMRRARERAAWVDTPRGDDEDGTRLVRPFVSLEGIAEATALVEGFLFRFSERVSDRMGASSGAVVVGQPCAITLSRYDRTSVEEFPFETWRFAEGDLLPGDLAKRIVERAVEYAADAAGGAPESRLRFTVRVDETSRRCTFKLDRRFG